MEHGAYFGRIESQLLKEINDGVQALPKLQEMLQRVTTRLDRSLAAFSSLTANQFSKCPNLVWVFPMSVDKKEWKNPKNWITNAVKQKYKVVFICADSGEAGHEPFAIEMPKAWIAKIAPWLKLCLLALKCVVNAKGLPFPIPDLKYLDQSKAMTKWLGSVMESGLKESANALLSHCETVLENGTKAIDGCTTYGQMQTLAGDSYKFIVEMAEKQSQWRGKIIPVLRDRSRPVKLVIVEYQQRYYG